MAIRTGWLPESRAAVKGHRGFPWSALAALVGAAIYAWYAWLWLVDGEFVGAAMLMGPLLVVFTIPLALAAGRRTPDYDIAGLLLFGLIIRLGFTYYRFTHAVDGLVYHLEGLRLAAYYRHFDFGAPTDAPVPGTGAMRAIAGFAHVVAFDDSFASFLVLTWLGFLGVYLLYRAFEIGVPDGDRPRYAKLLMLWPSMCFWPSSLGKDAWMVFTIGIAALGIARIYQRLAGGYTLLGLGLLAASFVRPHLALLAIVAFTVALVVGNRKTTRDVVTPGFIAKILGVLLVLIIGSVLVSRTEKLLAIDDFSASSIQSASNYLEGQTSLGGSQFTPANPRSPTGFPQAAVTVLFRPFPFEASGFEQLFTSLEGVVLGILTVAAARRLITLPRRLRSQPYITFALCYVLLWILAFGVIANFGILARQRTQMLPFYFVVLAVPTTVGAVAPEPPRRILR